MADTVEIEEEGVGVVAEEEDVVNDLTVAGLNQLVIDCGGGYFGEPLAEEALPFLTHKEHEGAVASRAVERSKRHNVEGEEHAVRSSKAELGAVGVADTDLVESGFGVDTDPVKEACARRKVVDGLVAAGNGKAVWEGDGVKSAVVDAKAPNKFVDVGDVLLVWLGS